MPITFSFLVMVAEKRCVLQSVVVISVVCLIAGLSFVHKLAAFVQVLSYQTSTSAYHPNSWLLVCGKTHLSLGTWVTVLSRSLI